MASVLDFYAAVMLAMAGTAYRVFSARPEPDAFPVMAMLVALAMSTYAQRSFGLDGPAGRVRYRLLPVRGWQLMLAKDGAYLAVLAVLVVPLSLKAGITFGLVAVAVGRWPAIKNTLQQEPWRFLSGDPRFGIVQIVAGAGMGLGSLRVGNAFLFASLALYGVSVAAGGWIWDRGSGS